MRSPHPYWRSRVAWWRSARSLQKQAPERLRAVDLRFLYIFFLFSSVGIMTLLYKHCTVLRTAMRVVFHANSFAAIVPLKFLLRVASL